MPWTRAATMRCRIACASSSCCRVQLAAEAGAGRGSRHSASQITRRIPALKRRSVSRTRRVVYARPTTKCSTSSSSTCTQANVVRGRRSLLRRKCTKATSAVARASCLMPQRDKLFDVLSGNHPDQRGIAVAQARAATACRSESRLVISSSRAVSTLLSLRASPDRTRVELGQETAEFWSLPTGPTRGGRSPAHVGCLRRVARLARCGKPRTPAVPDTCKRAGRACPSGRRAS